MYRCILIDFILHACFAWLLWNVAVSTAHVVYVMCGYVRVLQNVPIQWNHLEMLTVQENFRQTQIKSFHWNEYEYRVMNIKTNAYDYYKGLHVSARGNIRIDIEYFKRNKNKNENYYKMNAKIISKSMYLSSLVQPLEQLFAFVLYKICTAYQLRLNALKSHIAHIPYTFSRRIEKWIAWKEGEREKNSTNRETMMLYRYAYKYEIRKAIKSVWNVTKENSRATYYGVVFDVIRIRFDSVDFIFFSFVHFLHLFYWQWTTSLRHNIENKNCLLWCLRLLATHSILIMGEMELICSATKLFRMFD